MIDFETDTLFKLRKTDNGAVKCVEPLLIPGEEIIGCYKTVRDSVIFTTRRIIAINVQGATGVKKDFTSMPYSKIQVFSVETAGLFDMDSELELYFSGVGKVCFAFTGSSDIVRIGQAIGSYVL